MLNYIAMKNLIAELEKLSAESAEKADSITWEQIDNDAKAGEMYTMLSRISDLSERIAIRLSPVADMIDKLDYYIDYVNNNSK